MADRWRPAHDPRRAVNRRRETSVQIRKRRKEEVLRRKRGISTTTIAPSAGGACLSSSCGSSSSNLETALNHCLSSPGSASTLVQLQTALSGSDSAAAAFWQDLLSQHERKARTVVSSLMDNLQLPPPVPESALNLLLEITSVINSSSAAVSSDDDAYYGRAPLQWSDLFVPTTTMTDDDTGGGQPNAITVLLGVLSQLASAEETNNSSAKETVFSILGNLVQDSPRALRAILPHWSLLTDHLPCSSYCCAAVIRNDSTHYGMDFLQSLTTFQIAELLALDNDTATEAAWILEGLSGREDDAVHVLCRNGTTANGVLLSRLVQRMNRPEATMEFLVPALRAVANLCSACDGQYVPLLLEQQLALVPTMTRLLEQATVLDAVTTAACLLTDAGLPGHPSTENALPQFLPRLVAILLSSQATFSWRREAAYAISTAVAVLPPGLDPHSQPPHGRGRGRTLPAWMQQQQS